MSTPPRREPSKGVARGTDGMATGFRRRACVGMTRGAILSAMSRRFRASIFFASVALSLFAIFASHGLAASRSAARIVILGTDDQLYTCSGECAKAECITCPVRGLQVRAPSNLRRVSMRTQFDIPGMPPEEEQPEEPRVPMMKFGWPTFSPDGTKLAYSWVGRDSDGNQFGISVFDFARHLSIP